jgi:hypothetical protein
MAEQLLSMALQYPIEVDGAVISQIRLRRPTVGDVMAANREGGTPAEVELRMVASLSGLSLEAIQRIDMQDYGTLQAMMSRLLSSGAGAGSVAG